MGDNVTTIAYRTFVTCLVLSALAAYAIGPVPLPWIAQALTLALAVWIGFKAAIPLPPGMILFATFLVYSIIVTLYKCAVEDFYMMMPVKATTGYFTFISLRFFSLASFGAFAACTYWLLLKGYRARILRLLTWMCLIFSLAGFYIYIAQVYGLPEPPRTRIGTTGGEQATKFTYAFHRAMGTFREPSQLAEFLILPLLVSLSQTGWMATAARTIGIITLLLTGSLSGMSAIVAGLAGGLILIPYMNAATFKIVGRLGVILAIGLTGFSLAVSGYGKAKVDLAEVLLKRLEPIKEKGATQSNRGYVFKYLDEQELGWLGDGLGNSNLKFAKALHAGTPVAFLSLFINTLISLGYIGITMLVVFLLMPFIMLIMNRRYKYESDHYMILASFFGWMVSFTVHSEEFSLQFAVIYALLLHSFMQKKPDSGTGGIDVMEPVNEKESRSPSVAGRLVHAVRRPVQ